jgi:excisionase family DNA binding protein
MEDRLAARPDALTGEARRLEIRRARALLTAALSAKDEAEERLAELGEPPHAEPPREPLLDAKGAAAYAGVHPNTVYEAAKAGRLSCRKVGRLPRFTVADLDAWMGARP